MADKIAMRSIIRLTTTRAHFARRIAEPKILTEKLTVKIERQFKQRQINREGLNTRSS